MVWLAVTASVAALALSGCASAKPSAAPTDRAASASTPTAKPAPNPGPVPAARTVPGCEELATPSALGRLLGADVTALDAHRRDLADTTLSYEIEAAGGLSCLWGESGALDPRDYDAARFEVQVLPHADAAWKALPASSMGRGTTPGADYDGHPSRGGNCDIGNGQSLCWTNVFVNGEWLAATANSTTPGALTEAAFHATVLAMVPTLEHYAPASNDTATPAPAPSAGDSLCLSDETAAAMQSSFGVRTASYAGIETAMRIQDALLFVPGREYCPFQSPADGGDFLAAYTVTPHAATQFAAFAALLKAQPIDVATVPLTGAQGATSGLGWSSTRSSDVPSYRLDFLDGDDWVQVYAPYSAAAPAQTAAFAQWYLGHGTP